MPCYDPYTVCDSRLVEDLTKNCNKVTRAACDMRTILRRNNLESQLTVETRNWIKEHDEFDCKRIAEEEASGLRATVKQQALDKLTLEERRALGL